MSDEKNQIWRSVEEKESPDSIWKQRNLEYSLYHEKTEEKLNLTRREFLKLMGSSLALAGVSGCLPRKTARTIRPLQTHSEGHISGRPRRYATALNFGTAVQGVEVISYEHRPIKVEGQKDHPFSYGATNHWAQAKVLDLYDVDRLRTSSKDSIGLSFEDLKRELKEQFPRALKKRSALIVDAKPSPCRWHLIEKLRQKYPNLKVYVDDPLWSPKVSQASLFLGSQKALRPFFQLKKARVVVSFSNDFLGLEGDTVRYAKDYGVSKKVSADPSSMPLRLYSLEPYLTLTGSNADHRLTVSENRLGSLLLSCAQRLQGHDLNGAVFDLGLKGDFPLSEEEGVFVQSLVSDLLAYPGESLIAVGASCPLWMQALAGYLNAALGNVGKTLRYEEDFFQSPATLKDFVEEAQNKPFETVLFLNTNPVETSSFGSDLLDIIEKASFSLALASHAHLTASSCQMTLALSHEFESWGDVQATDGTVSIQQPLIDPLGATLSDLDFLGWLNYGRLVSDLSLLKVFWKNRLGTKDRFPKNWFYFVQKGFRSPPSSWDHGETFIPDFLDLIPKNFEIFDEFECLLQMDYSVADGRLGNSSWLQEMPDPLTKLVWDNALFLNPDTMKSEGLKQGQFVRLESSLNQKSLEIPVFPLPGTAPQTLVVNRGYGRQQGNLAKGAGFAVESFFPFNASQRVYLKPLDRHYSLVTTQTHHSMEKRPLIRYASWEAFLEKPDFVNDVEVMPHEKVKSHLWKDPHPREAQQWGMTVDLNSCTGCSACVVACQAENNIPVVGKKRVEEYREMHWIRLDRYFAGPVSNPRVLYQPVMCQHCENAPCESVCPFNATMHDHEGLNVQAYQRCGGTRFCGDNCAYRVRRFNFFNYPKENQEANPLTAFQRNPDVTVRFRGVMEKCTYCLHRIRQEQRDQKVYHGRDRVPDQTIQTACQSVCPTDAIVFGDVSDPESLVTHWKEKPQNYQVLKELNTVPRTSYLAKLFNEQESLASGRES